MAHLKVFVNVQKVVFLIFAKFTNTRGTETTTTRTLKNKKTKPLPLHFIVPVQ